MSSPAHFVASIEPSPKSQLGRVTLQLVVYRQSVHLCAKPLVGYDQSFWVGGLNPYGHSSCETASLIRGWVCLL
jgi:hypothetical protein